MHLLCEVLSLWGLILLFAPLERLFHVYSPRVLSKQVGQSRKRLRQNPRERSRIFPDLPGLIPANNSVFHRQLCAALGENPNSGAHGESEEVAGHHSRGSGGEERVKVRSQGRSLLSRMSRQGIMKTRESTGRAGAKINVVAKSRRQRLPERLNIIQLTAFRRPKEKRIAARLDLKRRIAPRLTQRGTQKKRRGARRTIHRKKPTSYRIPVIGLYLKSSLPTGAPEAGHELFPSPRYWSIRVLEVRISSVSKPN